MIIADTGFFLALGNRKDKDHSLAIQTIYSQNEALITTYPVITETCYLLLARIGNQAQINFLQGLVNDNFEIFHLQNHGSSVCVMQWTGVIRDGTLIEKGI
jgi:predicted nucleic acid-binding protein